MENTNKIWEKSDDEFFGEFLLASGAVIFGLGIKEIISSLVLNFSLPVGFLIFLAGFWLKRKNYVSAILFLLVCDAFGLFSVL